MSIPLAKSQTKTNLGDFIMTKTSESYGEFSTFPTKLRKLMEERKVTNKKLSEICSVKAQSVSQWAHGKTRPDILSLVKIAEFFNVSTDYLLGLTNVKTPNKDIRTRGEMIEEKEKSPKVEDIISSLKALQHDLSVNDNEAIKVIARRWFSVDKSVGEKEKAEMLHSAYNQALNEAVKMLSTFLEHSEHSGLL